MKIKILGKYGQDEFQNGEINMQKVMAQIVDP